MSATLPKIPPRRTPVNMAMPRAVSVSATYPPFLPPATDITRRVNPLQPHPPQRRTVMLETADLHWHNEERASRMRQREHYRYHNAWSKYYYGSHAEKEAYRTFMRSVLKDQMSDNSSQMRQSVKDKVSESELAVAQDRQTLVEDAVSLQRQHTYLQSFRDENKKLMELSWEAKRRQRLQDNRYEQEALRYNPINWSCSLK